MKWSFHITGSEGGQALPTEATAIFTKCVNELKQAGFEVKNADLTLQGKVTDILERVSAPAGAGA